VGAVQQRRLGRLDHRSSVLIYGAAALAEVDQDAADASTRRRSTCWPRSWRTDGTGHSPVGLPGRPLGSRGRPLRRGRGQG